MVLILFVIFVIFFGSSNFQKFMKGTTIFIESEEAFDQSYLPTLTFWVKQGMQETNMTSNCLNGTSDNETITCLQKSFVSIYWNLSNIDLFTVKMINDRVTHYSFNFLNKSIIGRSYGLALNGLKLHINNSNNIFKAMTIGINSQEKVDLLLHDTHFFLEDNLKYSDYGMQEIRAQNSKINSYDQNDYLLIIQP